METLEYLTRARHLWWIVLVPVLAGVAAGLWQREQPAVWSATADVAPVVTGASGQGSGAISANEYASAFPAIAMGTPLLLQVSDSSGVAVDVLRSDLDVSRSGDSTAVSVTFSSTDRDVVRPVLEQVTGLTLQRVFQGEVDQAAAAVERARTQVAEVDARTTEFGTRTGVADPRQTYQALLNQLNNLDVRRVDASATGDTALAAALAAEAERARASLAGYVPLLTEYDALLADRATAQGRLDRALEREDLAQERVAVAAPENVVYVSEPVEQSPTLALARAAAVAAAVALVLCLLLASMLAGLGRTRAVRRQRASGPSGDRAADPAAA